MPNLLEVAKTGLFAAQAAITTTGNNISNAATPGYSRQRVIQNESLSVQYGPDYFGNGVRVADVERSFNKFLNTQMVKAQSASSGLDTYLAQVSQIDDMLSDPAAGLTPAIQDFFKGVQNLSSNPTQARQAMLSAAESLAGRFRTMESRLGEIADGVNSEISTNILAINAHADQLAKLNQTIQSLTTDGGHAPNDLLDQRDQIVNELSKSLKVDVTEEGASYTVTFGNGQPLVVGNRAFALSATTSPTDNTKITIGYNFSGKSVVLNDSLFSGGALGGLLQFRSQILDESRNSMGRIAIALASSFNDQHRLGQDSNGDLGGDFFKIPAPHVVPAKTNSAGNDLQVDVQIADVAALTTSNYEVGFDGTDYSVTRMSDGKKTTISPYPQLGPQRIDGLDFSLSAPATALRGDSFLVQPTLRGAAGMQVAITDINKIAAAAPVTTAARTTTGGVQGNIGTAAASVGEVDKDFAFSSVTPAVTLTFDAAAVPPSFNFEQGGAPLTLPVTVTKPDGTVTNFAAGAPVEYTSGAKITFGGVSFTLSGQPANGDSFKVGANAGGVGDNRNAQLLGALQTKNILNGNHQTFQGGYAALVGLVGNKTGELKITAASAETLLMQTTQVNQSVSGVNLDEEAANLLKYQQAYQAAGKVMQIASQLFDTLLNLR